MTRIAVCGGVYSNPYALRAVVEDARAGDAEQLYLLGDLGGCGAEPDAIWPLLVDNEITVVADNYDVAIGRADTDCGCGYAHLRDNEFAQLIFDYTLRHTSRDAQWMTTLSTERRFGLAGVDVHRVHGSTLALND